jgi:hypothetical protein
VRAASVALIAAAIFFAGVLVGGRAVTGEAPPPTPVVLVAAEPGSLQPTPRASPLDVEEVPREVEEGSIEDYDDDDEDSSGPGSGEDDDDDNSGPGSSGSGSDNSGSSSGNSGSDDD